MLQMKHRSLVVALPRWGNSYKQATHIQYWNTVLTRLPTKITWGPGIQCSKHCGKICIYECIPLWGDCQFVAGWLWFTYTLLVTHVIITLPCWPSLIKDLPDYDIPYQCITRQRRSKGRHNSCSSAQHWTMLCKFLMERSSGHKSGRQWLKAIPLGNRACVT